MFRNQVLNKKGTKKEVKVLARWCQNIRELSTNTVRRNPNNRTETTIKISVSEGNVTVFPNMLILDKF